MSHILSGIVIVKRWLELRYDYDTTAIRLRYDKTLWLHLRYDCDKTRKQHRCDISEELTCSFLCDVVAMSVPDWVWPLFLLLLYAFIYIRPEWRVAFARWVLYLHGGSRPGSASYRRAANYYGR
jgi:hypothetical protein